MDAWVTIVGAGPAGLLLALLLAQAKVPVKIIDKSDALDNQPRATHYSSPAVYELRRAGVLDEASEQGYFPDYVMWRNLDGTELGGLDNRVLDDLDRVLCLPLNQLGVILHRHLLAAPTAQILWSHQATRIGQDSDHAWVDVETPTGQKRLRSSYVVGCDGANSLVRRSLFGDLDFPGTTWDLQVIATNLYYDFDKFNWPHGNFIIDPEHWYMAAKITKNGLWRVTYGEIPGLSREEYLARQPGKFEKMLPGHPKPDEYHIVNFSPYKVHQRLAKSMRVGRILLASDAAHLCNPFGGLGLTGGLVDAGNLFDCLIGVYTGNADETILDEYSKIRREKYQQLVDPISSANLRRLCDTSPEIEQQRDDFFKFCKECEKDVEALKLALLSVNTLKHDFRQMWRPENREDGKIHVDKSDSTVLLAPELVTIPPS